MKPFNLEEAKAGKPVCTLDGRDVRILCFDRVHKFYPIVGLIKKTQKYSDISEVTEIEEDMDTWQLNGGYDHEVPISIDDLCMKLEKKEGWINIYPGNSLGKTIYSSEKEAVKGCGKGISTTIKIEWEE